MKSVITQAYNLVDTLPKMPIYFFKIMAGIACCEVQVVRACQRKKTSSILTGILVSHPTGKGGNDLMFK